jgi:putative DNA primase/helicase
MIAAGIAAALGGAHRSDGWLRCRCPMHESRGATLALRDGERGLLLKCFGGCHPRDVLAELRRRGLLDGEGGKIVRPDPDTVERHREAEARDRQRRIANALDLWGECHSAPGTIVERYLRSRELIEPIPHSLRMHGMLRHRESGGSRPAMVGLVEHVEHGPVGVHLTYLSTDGSMQATVEPRKRSLGPVGGGAVRLAPAAELLMVGEGIETALAAMQATAQPAWAALSTSGLMGLILPPVVRTVAILADNDANGASERAAFAAADRWLSEGRRVKIAIPPEPRTDFADVLLGRACARIVEARDVAA